LSGTSAAACVVDANPKPRTRKAMAERTGGRSDDSPAATYRHSGFITRTPSASRVQGGEHRARFGARLGFAPMPVVGRGVDRGAFKALAEPAVDGDAVSDDEALATGGEEALATGGEEDTEGADTKVTSTPCAWAEGV